MNSRQLESVGAGQGFDERTEFGKRPVRQDGAPIPAGLLTAAAEARQQHFREAEADPPRGAWRPDAQNSALHFALGVIYRQQEQWDEAYDELAAGDADHA